MASSESYPPHILTTTIADSNDSCRAVGFRWNGGTPSYDLKIQVFGGILVELSQPDQAVGTLLSVEIVDSTGESSSSGSFPPEDIRPAGFSCQTNSNFNESETVLYLYANFDFSVTAGTITGTIISTATSAVTSTATSSSATPTSSASAPATTETTVHSSSSPTNDPTPIITVGKHAGLSTGAIAGIAVGITVSVTILAVLAISLLRKDKKRKNQRRKVQPYASGLSMLDKSEPQLRNSIPSSPSELLKRIQDHPLSNAFVPSTLSVEAKAPRDTIRSAGDLLSSASREATLGSSAVSQPPLTPSPSIMQTQDMPVSRKTRRDQLPTR